MAAVSLELAIKAIRSGRKEEGRQLLNLLIQQDPNDEKAWLWMSSVVDTDEQRARCLYHVLAINPENDVARRGLQVLGIVISDSRPVKVPRDSQPIRIPKPSSKPLPQSTPAAPAGPGPAEQRRPFRIDPAAIVNELPFTPIKAPFSTTAQEEAVAYPARGVKDELDTKELTEASTQTDQPGETGQFGQPQMQAGPFQDPSEPVPVVHPNTEEGISTELSDQEDQPPRPSKPVPVIHPSTGEQVISRLKAINFPQPGSSQPIQPAIDPSLLASPTSYPNQAVHGQQQSTEAETPPGTRPSQPVPVIHSNTTAGMPLQAQPVDQAGQWQQAAGPGASIHSDMTMGVPTQHLQPQMSSQPVPAIHSSATLGMPMPAQPAGQTNQSSPSPAGSMPVMQNTPPYGQPQYQQPLSPNLAIHSNSTMAMPMGYDPMAALRATSVQDNRTPSPNPSNVRDDLSEEDGEEINILAVIIFGSLCVTAFGGLGMLILLMLTTSQ